MNVIVTGSISYDRIMDYPDRFANHILPDKAHILNVSFVLDTLDERFGGTAGNIAHNLKLIGIDPWIVGAAGDDFGRYKKYLASRGISTEWVARIQNERTSVAHMITDLDDNQISAFYPGAMKHGAGVVVPKELAKKAAFFIVAPSSKDEITKRCLEAKQYGIPYLFDPGQQMTTLSSEELSDCAMGSAISIFNDYEWQLFQNKTKHTLTDLVKKDIVVVVTKGHEGSSIHANGEESRVGIAKPHEVVDPTGAGDAYRVGIVAGYINKWNWKEAGQLAATVASFAIEKYGTQEHKPSVQEINERYKKNFGETSPL